MKDNFQKGCTGKAKVIFIYAFNFPKKSWDEVPDCHAMLYDTEMPVTCPILNLSTDLEI